MAVTIVPETSALTLRQGQVASPSDKNADNKKRSAAEPFQVFVRLWTGKTLCISAPAAASGDENTAGISVQLLTDKVMAATQVDPSHFYFVVECKPLRKDQILSPKRNNQTTTIHCHYRNPGGCFIFSLSILTIIFFATIGSVCTCGLSLFIIPLLVPFLFILPCFCL